MTSSISDLREGMIKLWTANNEAAELLFGPGVPGGRTGLRWAKQREIADAIVQNKYVAVATCHACGKTDLVAELAVQFSLAHYPSFVTILSSSWETTKDTVFARIRHKIGLLRQKFPTLEEPSVTEWWPLGKSKQHAIICRSPMERENIAGLHNQSNMFICDEASALENEILAAMFGSAVKTHDRIVLTGNPLNTSGAFADALTINSSKWRTFNISYLDTPNFTGEGDYPTLITPAWVEMMKLQYANNPAELLPRLYGQIPDETDFTVISRSALVQSTQVVNDAPGTERIMSVDISWGGDDFTVFLLRDEHRVLEMESVRGLHEPDIVAEILAKRDRWRPDKIYVDATGNPSVWHYLERAGCDEVEGVVYSRKAHDADRFSNVRAEFYTHFKEALREGFHIPQQFIQPFLDQCGIMSERYQGKIKIEDKNKMKARLGRSPDEMDALAQSFVLALGDRAFGIASRDHAMGVEPVLSYNGETWNLEFPGWRDKWPGLLMRAIWLSRANGHYAVWVHADYDGCWRVIHGIKVTGTMREAAYAIHQASFAGKVPHTYEYDLMSSVDDQRLMLDYQEELDALFVKERRTMETPMWFAPEMINGKRGADMLDRLLHGALSYDGEGTKQFRTGEMIFVWPRPVLRQLMQARLTPGVAQQAGDEGKENIVDGGGGYVRCLRMLCVAWADADVPVPVEA